MAWSLQQVAEHNTSSSCWVIIKNKVYDVTDFLPEHPGGASIILRYAGKDATMAYESIHPPNTLDKNLSRSQHLGELDAAATNTMIMETVNRQKTKDELRVEKAQRQKPPLNRILNIQEMNNVARKVLSYKAFAYYASASDDEITKQQNAAGFSRFIFHPRVLRPVVNLDMSTTLLGMPSRLPIMISPAALARLGHPLGEANLVRGAHRMGIIQIVSSNASLSYQEIMNTRPDSNQALWFQLYKSHDMTKAEARVDEVVRLGYKVICLTVDALVPGNRERDVRAPWDLEAMEKIDVEGDDEAKQPGDTATEEEIIDMGGTAGALIGDVDRNMSWAETIPWLRSKTTLPIVIKGIQCVADAVLAAEAGVEGIIVSNHGGRSLEYSPPSIEVLYRIRRERPDVFDKLEVYMDGGVRRGTDILKALCLGAKAVGLGRPYLYAQSAYGAAGVVKITQILERELTLGMQLIGARTLKDLVPEMVEKIDWQPVPSKL